MNFISNWLDKTLIPEWRRALKMLSVQWGALCLAAAPIWGALSDEQRASLLGILGIRPEWYVVAAVAIGIYLRLKNQGIAEPKE
jgi:hypothetical protein